MCKLYWSEYHQRVSELAMQIMGADGLVPTGRRPANMSAPTIPARRTTASWIDTFLQRACGDGLRGTSEIQRNILGEQVLGLPREAEKLGRSSHTFAPREEAVPELLAVLREVVHVRHPRAHEHGDVGGLRVGRGSACGSGHTSRSPTPTNTGTVTAAASSATHPGLSMSVAHGGMVADPHTGTRPLRVG